MVNAPIRISQRDGSAHRFLADIIEKSATDYFANLGFIVYQQIFGDTLDDLGDSLLPLRVPLGHFDLATRQADYRRAAGRTGHRHCEVLNERVKAVRLVAIAVEIVQNLVEQN